MGVRNLKTNRIRHLQKEALHFNYLSSLTESRVWADLLYCPAYTDTKYVHKETHFQEVTILLLYSLFYGNRNLYLYLWMEFKSDYTALLLSVN